MPRITSWPDVSPTQTSKNYTSDPTRVTLILYPRISPRLGHRSYIDGILVAAESWDPLCDKVDRLLDACDQ
ncbi:hypothetical protein L917_21743 [Phytophthora nicotianae]|uniref:Uncharacterized protein n=1 Tax=Phytophthora nicotianae TaxID=4792 RepID=W2JYD3_PHYNI|nr:hypothetical protein L917_21743 [Phytophthora nicotianae]